MTSYPCNKYEQITPSYRLSVKYNSEKDKMINLRYFFSLETKDARTEGFSFFRIGSPISY